MKATPRVVAAVALVACTVLILVSEGVHRGLLQGLEFVEHMAAGRPGWAMAFVVVFAALAAMLAFVSSWVLVPFAVFTWGTPLALLLLFAGWLLGGAMSYAIGRFVGRRAVRWLISAPVVARYEDRISHRMPFSVLLLVQFALPSEIPGYLLGIVHYPFTRYFGALALVELTYAVATVYLGVGVVERRLTPAIAAGAALALLTAWAVYALRRRLTRERRVGPRPAPVGLDDASRATSGATGVGVRDEGHLM
jgi:uncharacterized membrane protein YdjX (TVP38/TMEM64 family)